MTERKQTESGWLGSTLDRGKLLAEAYRLAAADPRGVIASYRKIEPSTDQPVSYEPAQPETIPGEISELEYRVFHAANSQSVPEPIRQLIADVWKAACNGTELTEQAMLLLDPKSFTFHPSGEFGEITVQLDQVSHVDRLQCFEDEKRVVLTSGKWWRVHHRIVEPLEKYLRRRSLK